MSYFFLTSENNVLSVIRKCEYIKKIKLNYKPAILVEVDNVVQIQKEYNYYAYKELVICPRQYIINSIKPYFDVLVYAVSNCELLIGNKNENHNWSDFIFIGIGEIFLTYADAVGGNRIKENNQIMFKRYFKNFKSLK